ncbi:ABC transporter substrate-binding protein [Sporosarcina sp. ACRSL]|uniref:ABC transporter substrate-binding protein n=1 Tax=Sporosarcina sp. ACRSL TaxID=2918215 RepID=UPI001EF655D2|nr:ABC transporter substrate-binding protein [Sporosarcina sp. ACRSL]MCG7344006.1 ABC transporter substrate-binding protein [Sporosarcina sp. ACRSL]
MFGKKMFLGILLLISLIVVACSNSSVSNNEENEGDKATEDTQVETVTVAQTIGIDAMNPYAHSAIPVYGIWRHVMEPLVEFDFETTEYYGVLAESWTVENETDWIFTLRKDVKFHDGSEFTADDVVHTYNRIMTDPESLQTSFLALMQSVEKVDSHTVKLVTKQPSASILKELILLYISSGAHYEELGQEEADKNPIGTGPYKYKEWKRSENFVVEKYPEYWGGTPEVNQVVFRTMPEDVARVAALERGEVDIIPAPTQDLERLKNLQGITVEGLPSLRMMFYVMNPTIEPFDDVRVRQAINYAIDIDSLIEHVQESQVNKLNGPVADNVFGYNPEWEAYPFDQDKARELLAEAGYKDGLDINIVTPTDRYLRDVDVTEAVASMLKEVGINVTVQTPEWAVFSSEYKEGAYGMYLIGRGPVFDADIVLRQYFRTGVTKRSMYSNPEFDKILDDADMNFDVDEREKLLQEAGTVLFEDAPAVFLYTNQDNYAYRSKLKWVPRSDEQIRVGFPSK